MEETPLHSPKFWHCVADSATPPNSLLSINLISLLQSFLFLSFFEVIQLGWCTSIAWPLHTILIGNVQRRFKKIVLFADLERGERR